MFDDGSFIHLTYIVYVYLKIYWIFKRLLKALLMKKIACHKFHLSHRIDIIEIQKECWVSGWGQLVNNVKEGCTSFFSNLLFQTFWDRELEKLDTYHWFCYWIDVWLQLDHSIFEYLSSYFQTCMTIIPSSYFILVLSVLKIFLSEARTFAAIWPLF